MSWPPHATELRKWSTSPNNRDRSGRRAPIEDRLLTEITVSIPPIIATITPDLTAETRQALEAATIAAARLDAVGGRYLGALSGFLLRSESVASSRIEQINPDPLDSAKAFAGINAGREALLVAAAARASTSLITSSPNHLLTATLDAHNILLCADHLEGSFAGKIRDVQNWIGGNNFTPRNAIYVPPPPEHVADLLKDLFLFAQREDISAVAQAAIVHAQFESIHPFTDGNGRIGRALINTIFRHRNLTQEVVVPVASVMLTDTDLYFEQLTAYRAGDADSFVRYLAIGVVTAVEATIESAADLVGLPEMWHEKTQPRAGSTASFLLEQLLGNPVITSSLALKIASSFSRRAVFKALDQLEAAEVLTEVTGGKSRRVWVAQDVLDELDRLTERIGRRQLPKL